jgi:hypothetical protein
MGNTPSKRSRRPLGKRAKRLRAKRSAEREAGITNRKARQAFEVMAAESLGMSMAELRNLLDLEGFGAALHNELGPLKGLEILSDTLMLSYVDPWVVWDFMHLWAKHHGLRIRTIQFERCYAWARSRAKRRSASNGTRKSAYREERQRGFEDRMAQAGRPESTRRKF